MANTVLKKIETKPPKNCKQNDDHEHKDVVAEKTETQLEEKNYHSDIQILDNLEEIDFGQKFSIYDEEIRKGSTIRSKKIQ